MFGFLNDVRIKDEKLKKFLPIIGVTIFFYVLLSLDFKKIIDSFLSVQYYFIVLSSVLTIPRVLIRNYVWMLIQKEQKIKLSFLESLEIFLIGYFYGSITPGFIGKFLRIPYLKEKTDEPYGKLFVNTMIESVVHTFSLYGMIIIGAFVVMKKFPELLYVSTGWFLFLVIILSYFISRYRGEKFFNFCVKYFIPKRISSQSHQFVSHLYLDFPRLRKLIIPFLLGIPTWFIIFSQYYIFAVALNVEIPYLYFLVLFPVANAAAFIPVSFAGLGTRELTAMVIFSTIFHVCKEKIFVLSLLGFLITDLLTGFIGFLLTLKKTR